MKQKSSKKTKPKKSLKTNNAGQPSALLTAIAKMENAPGGMAKVSSKMSKKALAKKKF